MNRLRLMAAVGLIVVLPTAQTAEQSTVRPSNQATAGHKLKTPLQTLMPGLPEGYQSYLCAQELNMATIMIDPIYLHSKFGGPQIETLPSRHNKLRIMESGIADKDHIICYYGLQGGKILDLGYRRYCRNATKDSRRGIHAYLCAQ